MVKSFLIQRLGNKKNEIKHFKYLLPKDSKYIVEPFGGSFAVIREMYMDKKYKRYVNDNDGILYSLYKEPELYIEGLKKFQELCTNNMILMDKNNKLYPNTKIVISEFRKEDNKFVNMIIGNRLVRGQTIKHVKKFPDYTDSLEIISKINFSNEDWEDNVKKFLGKKNAFIFLDPPYLFSNNTQYDKQFNNDSDCSDIVIKIKDMMTNKNTKAKIMLIVNNLKLIKLLFGDLVKLEYDVIYQMSKKKDSHLVITNY